MEAECEAKVEADGPYLESSHLLRQESGPSPFWEGAVLTAWALHIDRPGLRKPADGESAEGARRRRSGPYPKNRCTISMIQEVPGATSIS